MAYFLDEKKKETVEHLVDQLASTFTLLANVEPGAALEVLNQFNEQYNEKICDELLDSRDRGIDNMAAAMHITEDQLDN